MMFDSGRLEIEVGYEASGWRGSIRSSRPAVYRRFVGGRADEVLAQVPRLYSICAVAQAQCASLALACARGATTTADVQPESGLRLAAEMAGEHLWRLWLDWPVLLGLPPRRAEFAKVHSALRAAGDPEGAAAAAALICSSFGVPAGQTLLADLLSQLAPEALEAASAKPESEAGMPSLLRRLVDLDPSLPDAAPRLLPDIGLSALLPRLRPPDDPAFAEAPTLDGAPAEVGALAEQAHTAPVRAWMQRGQWQAARVVARLAALDRCVQMLGGARPPLQRCESLRVGERAAVARVATARGPLLHYLRLAEDGERIADYTVAAPTEWNFHASGGLMDFIAHLPAPEALTDAERLLRAAVLARDPCVAWELRPVGRPDAAEP
jgi:hypothetical protein